MKKTFFCFFFILLQITAMNIPVYGFTFVPADNPYIQYFGRWDMNNPLHPEQSWPGVYIKASFSGSTIGVRMDDNVNYYNVYIDGKLYCVFHGAEAGEQDYIIARDLSKGKHVLRFGKRNTSFGRVFTFSGLLLEDGERLFKLPAKSSKKIEFIGDSFTVAEGNQAVLPEMRWEDKFEVTNIDEGFAPLIAKHFNAQYHITARSGIGMVCDWQGNFDISMPHYFDRTLMERPEPKWDFSKWIPQLSVICLGLNDMSGLKGKDTTISDSNSALFRKGYLKFINTVRSVYPGVKILAVAAYPEWIRQNVRRVVDKEKEEGHNDVYYSQFDYFPGGYAANGHPSVATHKKMAGEIIKSIEEYGLMK